MKRIILMRHAKSDWSNSDHSDHQRRLNNRGKRDAPIIGKRIREEGIIPNLALVSDAQRTSETWELIEQYFPLINVQKKANLYLASATKILECIRSASDDYSTILILAHNPGITNAFYELGAIKIDNVPTAGVGCLEFQCNSFSKISKNTAKLIYFTYPKKV